MAYFDVNETGLVLIVENYVFRLDVANPEFMQQLLTYELSDIKNNKLSDTANHYQYRKSCFTKWYTEESIDQIEYAINLPVIIADQRDDLIRSYKDIIAYDTRTIYLSILNDFNLLYSMFGTIDNSKPLASLDQIDEMLQDVFGYINKTFKSDNGRLAYVGTYNKFLQQLDATTSIQKKLIVHEGRCQIALEAQAEIILLEKQYGKEVVKNVMMQCAFERCYDKVMNLNGVEYIMAKKNGQI